MQIKNGSLLLFKLFGVNVYMHWSWALVAAFQIWRSQNGIFLPGNVPPPIAFSIAQYLCLFLIVLIHEFGHALACKSVGGRAERIVLWPLGGVAFVQPPPRAGALLWSIAAGPLVNVILVPLTLVPAIMLGGFDGHHGLGPAFVAEIAAINLGLLIFNMLPFYPLDGGQILRALAWFIFGRSISLIIAAVVGLVGVASLALFGLYIGDYWLFLIVGFMAMQSIRALKAGNAMHRMDTGPRWPNARCPHCNENPPRGAYWNCPCGMQFDTFATIAQCPRCARPFSATACLRCGQASPFTSWYPANTIPLPPPPPPPPIPQAPRDVFN